MHSFALLALGLGPHVEAAPIQGTGLHRIIVVLVDDMSTDILKQYSQDVADAADADFPATPTIDNELIPNGVRFTAAWSECLCSPSRAALNTGRWSPRTGVAKQILNLTSDIGLIDGNELILPEMLSIGSAPTPFPCAICGKWHLAAPTETGPAVEEAPVNSGYSYFAGIPFAHEGSYCNWTKFVDSSPTQSAASLPGTTTWLFSDQADSAEAWIATQPSNGNWLV
jgi:arylsulfatase A-like enzyme